LASQPSSRTIAADYGRTFAKQDFYLDWGMLAGDMFKTFIYVLFKFLLIAAVLASVTIWFRSDLIWCGVGISSVLIIGAIIINIRNRRNGKGEK